MPPSSSQKRFLHPECWRFKTDSFRLSVTREGGHLYPEDFCLPSGKKVSPYFIAPWKIDLKAYPEARVLGTLRGDFFCMPFGGASTYAGVRHSAHGEGAYAPWSFQGTEKREAWSRSRFELNYKKSSGKIVKEISVRSDENILYTEHRLSGFSGPMTYGHHPNLQLPSDPRSVFLSKSSYLFGQVLDPFEFPSQGGYSSLKSGALFKKIDSVPLAAGGALDLTTLPVNEGYTDIVTLASDPRIKIGCTTLVYSKEGFLWFSLKRTKDLPTSVLWLQQGGRHYPPWNGLRGVLGLEETMGLVGGLEASVKPNLFSQRKIPTHHIFKPNQSIRVPFIQGVCETPQNFQRVKKVELLDQEIVFTDEKNQTAKSSVQIDFLN